MSGRSIRFALLADGASDRALLRIISWVLSSIEPGVELPQPGFRARATRPRIEDEMEAACREFEPDVMFVHRDAEGQDPEQRRQEIPECGRRLIRVVPVRMTEAWLLFDEAAIRVAAGNPLGAAPLHLPAIPRVEQIPDPKLLLHECLLTAAEVAGRRRKRFRRDLSATVLRVAELISDFSPLRSLPAFARFERDCRNVIQNRFH